MGKQNIHFAYRAKDFEANYWKSVVKTLEPDKMDRYYSDLKKRMIEKGLRLPDKEILARLLIAGADTVSRTPEAAKDYLQEEGVNIESFIKKHLSQIKKLLNKKSDA